MEISLDRLRTASNVLFDLLERNGIRSVTISDDYYWEVPPDVRYNPCEEPTQHEMGQLSEDITQVNRLADGAVPAAGYGMVWLAAVLRRIGETVNC